MWEVIGSTIAHEFSDIPDMAELTRLSLRLLLAVLLGGLLGYERETKGKAAGIKTHMLVALGSAIFMVIPLQIGVEVGDLTRVMQGMVTGIGFLGAGTILKGRDEESVKGLTTAAGLWMTSAIGMTVGLGQAGSAVLCTGFALLVFAVWYPYPYREISGGRELFTLVVAVDVVLGPLITFVVRKRERKKSAGMRMDKDHGTATRLRHVDRPLQVFPGPLDSVTLSALAGCMRHKDGLTDQQAESRARGACTDQDGGRFQSVRGKEMFLHLGMQDTAEGQSCLGHHSPISLPSAASMRASWVTTLSVAEFQGAAGPRFRDQP